MGMGSAGTPPWVDEKVIDEEKQKRKMTETEAKLQALEKENEALKEQIKELEAEIKKLKK
jgi:predicted RNase H-like nuclease (RuvC/YqgF family)